MKALFVLTFLLFQLAHALEVPALKAPVMDQAKILGTSTERALSTLLRQANQTEQIQMAILTIEDLADESLEGYSIKVVDQWKLGQKETDKGLLLLIVKQQRKMRLEVGQGLEGDLPDAYAARLF